MDEPVDRPVRDPDAPEGWGPAALRRISWGAIFAGAVVALVIQIALGLLGVSIGLAALDPTAGDPNGGFAVGAGIWVAVSTIIALFVGGMVAGRLAGVPRTEDSMLHGIITWGVVTLLAFFFMTTAVGQVMSVAFGAVGQGVTAVAEDTNMRDMAAREMMVDVLATYGDMTPEEAEQTIQQYEQEVEQEAPGVAEDVVNTTAEAALWGFIAMLLGALAAGGGGALGTPRDLPASASLHRE